MKYLVSIYVDESQAPADERSPEEAAAAMKLWDDYTREVTEAGAFLAGEGLQPTATATSVRANGSGERIVIDGPFAETKEQLGGFYLLDCRDLDEAIGWAKKMPVPQGTLEVRPVMDYVSSELHSN
jgi:hypothetical protein